MAPRSPECTKLAAAFSTSIAFCTVFRRNRPSLELSLFRADNAFLTLGFTKLVLLLDLCPYELITLLLLWVIALLAALVGLCCLLPLKL